MAKKYLDADSMMHDQALNDEVADHLENFIDMVSDIIIYEGKDVKEIEDSKKVIRKACKNLRKGKVEKVYDELRFAEYVENCNNPHNYDDE